MQEALHIGPVAWGWVASIFTLSYGAFEIPSGMLGDRIGPRRVLTRIVLWWSGFTALTGMVTGYNQLLLARFFFGAGEAGAFPNASIAVARWFPAHERGRAFGVFFLATQFGGAIAPLLVVPIQARYGWRAPFYVFGIVGLIWSVVWYWWFRDSPREKVGVSQAELEETRAVVAKAHHGLPWGAALGSMNLWATMGMAFCSVYTFYFFQSWFHTYLVRARGYSENDLLLSSVPFLVGACGNFAGGLVSNALVKKLGLKWGRRSIALTGLVVAALCMAAVTLTEHRIGVLILLSLSYGALTFQQPTMFAVCLDIGGEAAGAVVGAMNTAGQIGSFVSSLAFGYLVNRYGSYNVPFIPMAALLLAGACFWLRVDPTQPLVRARVSGSHHA